MRHGDYRNSEFSYTSGDFHYGYRWIPTDKVEAIDQVEITEAFTTWQEADKIWIGWWFLKTAGGQSCIFTLKYLIKGGMRIYDTGDQFYWKAGPKAILSNNSRNIPKEIREIELWQSKKYYWWMGRRQLLQLSASFCNPAAIWSHWRPMQRPLRQN